MSPIVALSGAQGFVGRHVKKVLLAHGYEVRNLVRRKSQHGESEIFYDYERNLIDEESLRQCTAVIHLAGKNIMQGLWTKKVEKEIWESRVSSTKFIARTLADMAPNGPKIFICASASGYYGDRQDELLDEKAARGRGFLAILCEAWENATDVARRAGIRVVNTRFALVLGSDGGILKTYEKLFAYSLAAIIGSGKQYMPLVSVEDLAQALLFALQNPKLYGPINIVAESVPNEDFTLEVGQALHHKVRLRIPACLVKFLREQSELLLFSTRMDAKVLRDAGFKFSDPTLKSMLARIYNSE